MKKNLTTAVILLSTIGLTAQTTGIIKYKEVRKLDIEAPEGMDFADMLPESTTVYMDLYFDGKTSLYKEGKNNESQDIEMESEDGGMKIILKMDEAKNTFFTDLSNQKYLHLTSFMGKDFLIEEAYEKHTWKITGEKIKYLDYECHKATMSIPSQEDSDETIEIVAWFTPQIPVQLGPISYNQLPGAILMISEDGDQKEIMATEVIFDEEAKKEIKEPKKGKQVSPAEFDQIIDEKEKELKEMYGEGSTIIKN